MGGVSDCPLRRFLFKSSPIRPHDLCDELLSAPVLSLFRVPEVWQSPQMTISRPRGGKKGGADKAPPFIRFGQVNLRIYEAKYS